MDTKALRQKVLDLAIRGKLVPQDPNDEPASVLLERIRAEKQRLVKEGKLKAKDIKNDTIIFVGDDNLHYEKFTDGSVKCIEEEIPFELPEGWFWERLSNIASFSGGKTPSTSKREYWGNEMPWVTSKDMKSKYITGSQLMLSSAGTDLMQVYQPGTLLLVTRSGILRHTLPVAILRVNATINQDLKAISLYLPELAEYVYICFKGMEARLLSTYAKSGTTVENINFDEFSHLLLPIPGENLIEQIQKAVASAEEQIDLIEYEKENLVNTVVSIKSKILDMAIRGQLVPQNPSDEPASVLLERIRAAKEELIKQGKIKRDKKESIIFRGDDNSYYEKLANGSVICIDEELPFAIPDSWSWERLSNIAVFSGGKTPSTAHTEFWNGDIPWITSKDMKSKYVVSSLLKLSDLGAQNMQRYAPNTLLLVTRSGILRHTLPVAILKTEATINQDLKAIEFIDTSLAEYIYVCLKGLETSILQKYAKSGTTVENINFDEFKHILLPVPPEAERIRLEGQIAKITSHIDAISSILE